MNIETQLDTVWNTLLELAGVDDWEEIDEISCRIVEKGSDEERLNHVNSVTRLYMVRECARNIVIQRCNAPDTAVAEAAAKRNLELFPQLGAFGVVPKEVLDEADKD